MLGFSVHWCGEGFDVLARGAGEHVVGDLGVEGFGWGLEAAAVVVVLREKLIVVVVVVVVVRGHLIPALAQQLAKVRIVVVSVAIVVREVAHSDPAVVVVTVGGRGKVARARIVIPPAGVIVVVMFVICVGIGWHLCRGGLLITKIRGKLIHFSK